VWWRSEAGKVTAGSAERQPDAGFTTNVSCRMSASETEDQQRSLGLPRAGFSLSRALFRKNVGPLPNIWIQPDWIHTTCTGTICCHHRHFVNVFLLLGLFQLFPACCYVAKICRSSCGGPFLWGPLFGRTCWTCLNPPLGLPLLYLYLYYCASTTPPDNGTENVGLIVLNARIIAKILRRHCAANNVQWIAVGRLVWS